MTRSSRLRAASLAAVLLAGALGLSACGGSDPKAEDEPTTSQTTSTAPTPTPSPTPTPTAEPLSAFEDRAPVKAARSYVRAVDLAINNGEKSLASVAPWATPHGIDETRSVMSEDISQGNHMPGPEPFTPVNVQVRGNTARLSICMKTSGWSVSTKTNQPVNEPKIEAIIFEMRKVAGHWKYDTGSLGTGDCGGVKVVETRW